MRRKKPNDSLRITCITLPQAIVNAIDRRAALRGTSRSALVRLGLHHWLLTERELEMTASKDGEPEFESESEIVIDIAQANERDVVKRLGRTLRPKQRKALQRAAYMSAALSRAMYHVRNGQKLSRGDALWVVDESEALARLIETHFGDDELENSVVDAIRIA